MFNNQGSESKFNGKYTLDGTTGVKGSTTGMPCFAETQIRFEPAGVAIGNSFNVEARLGSSSTWNVLASIAGTATTVVDVSTYDYVRVNVTTASGTGEVIASGFFLKTPGSGGGSGTVTSVSVITANGISGSVANATSTPAITLNITALDATKIANGTVSSTEFQYLDGVTSAIQTQINAKGNALTTNPLSQFAATTSAQLAGVISDETGSGPLVFSVAPNLTGFVGVNNASAGGSLDVGTYVYNPGTVSVTGTTVTGTSADFLKTFKVGDSITTTTSSGSETKEIATISSATAMTTASAFAGTSTNTTYTNSNTGSQFLILPNGNIWAQGTNALSATNTNDWLLKANTLNTTGTAAYSALRDRTVYNQTVAATGAINTFAAGPIVNATGTGTFSNVRGVNAFPTVLGTNTGNITSLVGVLSSPQVTVGATGSIINVIGFSNNTLDSSTTNTVSNMYGAFIAPTKAGGTLTNYAGISVAAKPAAATNSSLLLLGTNTIPAGNYSIHSSSTLANYLNGNTLIGSSTDDGVNKLQVTGTIISTSDLTTGRFSATENTTAPNATVPVIQILGISSATNADIAIIPKGTGAIIADLPDSLATGGNKRGNSAVDLQMGRAANSQVANGNTSFLVGVNGTASGTSSICMGSGSIASGQTSVAIGSVNNASATGAVAIGTGGAASGIGSLCLGGNGIASATFATAMGSNTTASGLSSTSIGEYSNTFGIYGRVAVAASAQAATGDAQKSIFILRQITTDATASVMTCGAVGQNAASTTNQVILQNTSAIAFTGLIVGKQQATSTNSAAWKIEGLIMRAANAASTTLVASTVTVISNVPGWGTPTLTADTTNGGLAITIAGLAATNIKWTATVDTCETIY